MPWRLQEMKIQKPQRPNDEDFANAMEVLDKYSQYPFWAENLHAILLTDTGKVYSIYSLFSCHTETLFQGEIVYFSLNKCIRSYYIND